MEQHFSVAQVAERWGLSEDSRTAPVRKRAWSPRHLPPRGRYNRRRYRTFRIPKSVVERVHKAHLVVKRGW